MKKISFVASILLLIGAIFYANHEYGLLSWAGLTGQGLPTKKVEGGLADAPASSTIKIDHSKWTALLKKYVTDQGEVDYKGFMQDKRKLDDYLKSLSIQVPTNDWPVQDLLAYYINMYNAQTVDLILRNYPLKSIKDIDGPWTSDFVKIGNKKLSLGALEHSLLRKMNEPRIHFAINCASTSCPILSNEAYTPEKLNEQLEAAARGFINSDRNTVSKNTLELSRLFKWYNADFEDGRLIEFINPFTKIDISPDAEIDYKDYDWNLNEIR